MNNSKDKKLNLLKLGQASVLLTSLALPSIIGSVKVDATPVKPKVTTSPTTSPRLSRATTSTGGATGFSTSGPRRIGKGYNPTVDVWSLIEHYPKSEKLKYLKNSEPRPLDDIQRNLEILRSMQGPAGETLIVNMLNNYFGYTD